MSCPQDSPCLAGGVRGELHFLKKFTTSQAREQPEIDFGIASSNAPGFFYNVGNPTATSKLLSEAFKHMAEILFD